MFPSTLRQPLPALLLLYSALLAGLLTVLPFWLDEILQLIGTTQPDFGAFLTYHRTNPGGVPLGYLLQFALISSFGLNFVTARLPSVLAAVLACWAMAGVGREAGLCRPIVLVATFMVLPIQLRYAVEGRPYSHGLLFAILATWCLLRLARTERPRDAVLYSLAVAASLYSQGFAAFIQPGQVLWLFLTRRWRAATLATAGLALAGFLFLPWYAWTRPAWNQTITQSEFTFEASPRVGLALLREISGDGYAASLPLWIGAIAGVFLMDRRPGGLLASGVLSGVVLGFAADRAFSYFFAVRQFLFIAPCLVLLAVHAAFETRRRALAIALAVLFTGAALAKNYSYFAHPREDWAAAARLLREANDQGYCAAFVPKDEPRLYTLFEPSVEQHRCQMPMSELRAALAANLYTAEPERRRTAEAFQEAGYRAESQRSAGGTTLTLYRKTP